MTAKAKSKMKQGGIALAIISALGTGFSQYIKLEEEKVRQDKFEVFYSNEQDRINCALDSARISHKCNF